MKVNLVEEFVLGALVAGVTVQGCQVLQAVGLLLDDARESFLGFPLVLEFQARCWPRDLRQTGFHHIRLRTH